jgi:enediyne biosynthesis protein E5
MTDTRRVDLVDLKALRPTPTEAPTEAPTEVSAPTPEPSVPTSRPGTAPRVDGRDPRYLALRNFALSMSIFNVLGYTILGFEQPWTWPIFALLFGYSTEIAIEFISAWSGRRRPAFLGNGFWGMYTFLLPAHITALAVNMLLYANERFWPVAFAVVVAVGQKAVFRAPINGRIRHFMNPSNFGITVTLLVFSWVNIAPPYQFTENVPDFIRVEVPIIILTAGTVLNAMLTRKVPLIVGWLGGFVIQALLRHFIWGVALWAALLPMTGVAFILFSNYMITDPGTTPSKARHMFMFGSGTAMVYGVLMLFNIVYTLFFAVTIVCLLRGAYWWIRWLVKWRATARASGSLVADDLGPTTPEPAMI